MKKLANVLMLSALYALIIVAFASCEKEPNTPPTPDATEVAFKGALNCPNGCSVINDAIHIVIKDNGTVLKDFTLKNGEKKTFTGEEAKALIGKEYQITATAAISQNGNPLPTAIEPDTLVKTVAKGENVNSFTLTAISQTTEVSFVLKYVIPANYTLASELNGITITDEGGNVLYNFSLQPDVPTVFTGNEALALIGKTAYIAANGTLQNEVGTPVLTKIEPENMTKTIIAGKNEAIFTLSVVQ